MNNGSFFGANGTENGALLITEISRVGVSITHGPSPTDGLMSKRNIRCARARANHESMPTDVPESEKKRKREKQRERGREKEGVGMCGGG